MVMIFLGSMCCSSEDFKRKGASKNRQHMGYPPVTPNAVATDTILSQIFDQLWGEVGLIEADFGSTLFKVDIDSLSSFTTCCTDIIDYRRRLKLTFIHLSLA
jgi:hypothetical protein